MDVPPLVRRAAVVQIVTGGLGLLLVCGFSLLLSLEPNGANAAAMLIPPLGLLALLLLVPAVVAGVAVLRGNAWGPLLLTIVSTLQVLFVPIGTAIGGFTLWALWTSCRQPGRPNGELAPPRTEPAPQPGPREPGDDELAWPRPIPLRRSASPRASLGGRATANGAPFGMLDERGAPLQRELCVDPAEDGTGRAADHTPPHPRSAPPRTQTLQLLPNPGSTAPVLRLIAWVGLGFVAALAIGFWASGDPVPTEAIAITPPVVAVLIRMLMVSARAQRTHDEEVRAQQALSR